MTVELDPVKASLEEFGRSRGFVRRKRTWYRHTDDVTIVLDLQTSQYSRRYFLNIALWLKGLGAEQYPKEHHCHIRGRLSSFLPDVESEVDRLLDLEAPQDPATRRQGLLLVLQSRLDPLLDRAGTIDGIAAMEREGLFSGALITVAAQQFLRSHPVGDVRLLSS